ncbi:MAG: Outer rane receptor protein mostly Fe transport [Lacunisphaera sp.]|nr:Outer rane receptor protein mostly Fe transport [Lacunisphaera sp.]
MTVLQRRLAGLFAWSLALSATAALAQSTTPDPKEKALELSPFEVKPQPDRGYIASETMTGTRVATPIKDLPYSVNVITSEFFQDFGMFQLDDTLTQVGGLTGLDVGGGFNLRGFTSTSQLRDGFYRLGRYGLTNIDRLEVIKGPNAGIYGRTSPGGMVNMISKQPNKTASETLTLRYGSFDTAQATLEATGTFIDPNTSYIFIVSQFNRSADQDWFHIRENQGYLAIKHNFKDNSHLTLSAEYFVQYRNAPQSVIPIVTDQKGTATTTDDKVIGYATNLAKVNPYGPNSNLNRGSNTLYGTWDKQLTDIFSLRVGAQGFQANRWEYNDNTGWGSVVINSTNAANNYTSARGATPTRGLILEAGGGAQVDLLANYKLFNATVTNKTLLTIDFNDYYRYDPTRNSAATAAIAAWTAAGSGRVVSLNPDFSPVSPVTSFFPVSFADSGVAATTRLTRRRATVAGGLFRQESHWWNDTLLTYFGGRFDHVHFNERDYTATFNGVTGTLTNPNSGERTVTEFKPNVGALYKVKDNFRLYANYSESYFVNQTDNPSVILSSTYAPESAQGYDFGFKGSCFNGRLNYTIGGYYIVRNNVSVTDSVETFPGSGSFVDVQLPGGNQLDRGIEADLTWSINNTFSTGLSYGHTNAIWTDFGSKFPEAVGRAVVNIAPTNGGAWLKYAGSGALKGFSSNLGVTYVATTPTEVPNVGDVVARVGGVQTVTSSTNQWALTVPSYTLWNLGFSYKWKAGTRFNQTVRLNINNVFDVAYIKGAGGSGNKTLADGRGVYLSYALGFSHAH